MSEKRKLGRGAKTLLIGGLVIVIALLGWMLTPNRTPDDRTPALTSAPSVKAKKQTVQASGDTWAGLKAAGVPEPTDGDMDHAIPLKDGKAVKGAAAITLDESYGPRMAALKTLNALMDRNGDNEQWGLNVSATMGVDGAGASHPAGDAPRYWFAKRSFNPDSLCTNSGDIKGGAISTSDNCVDDVWNTSNEDPILTAPYFIDATFPVPSDLKIDDLTDPQDVVWTDYGVVYVPMNDGVWTFTEYCPASADGITAVDKSNHEVPVDSTGAYWPKNQGTFSFGTKERPCKTVEYTVAGQRPFWYTGK